MIYNIKSNEFSIKGPIFNFVLADEINRAPASAISLTGGHAGKASYHWRHYFKQTD
jgi:hypothetical protein